jgi:hypothetical protein
VSHAKLRSGAFPGAIVYKKIDSTKKSMGIFARSIVSTCMNSFETGVELARKLTDAFAGQRLSGVLVHATVSHDPVALLQGIRDGLPRDVAVLGCSTQGVVARDRVTEEGYVAAVMGLGGDSLHVSAAHTESFQVDSRAKARAMGQALRRQAVGPLKAVLIYYDPLCGADMDVFLAGLHEEVQCPVVGGAAAEFCGPMRKTYQYVGGGPLHHAAVCAGLSGDFTFEADISHGTSPLGIEMTVTKSDGPYVLEFDGKPALDVWRQFTDKSPEHVADSAAMLIGLPTSDADVYLVRSAFGLDHGRRAVMFQAGVPVGTRVIFAHRSAEGAIEGTARMGQLLAEKMKRKKVRAILGFECGGRTKPFLGKELTLKENQALQAAVSTEAEWLGMIAWGEVSMFDGRPRFVNFSFPVVVLADP